MKLVPEKSNAFVERLLAGAVVAAMVLVAFVARARELTADPYPIGVDGYYYAVQVRSLLETGSLHYPAAPLGFAWLAGWAALFGPVVGVKLGAAAGTALAVWPAYALAHRVSGSRAAALAGAWLVATSASSQFLAAEFLKQGLGLTVALAALAALAWALDRPVPARLAVVGALVLATVLTHKSAFALVLLVGTPAAWLELRARHPRRARQVLVAAGALTALVLVLGAFLPERFVGPRDLALFETPFVERARWHLPALELPGLRLELGHDALVGAALALAALALAAFTRTRPPALALGFVVLALVVAIPWWDVGDRQGVAFRLRASAWVVLAPLAAFVLARLTPGAAARAAACAGLVTLVAFTRPLDGREGHSRTHPALVGAVRALDGVVPPGATVLTQDRKVAFMARWYARQTTRLRPDAGAPAGYRLLPGAWITRELRAALAELRAAPVPGVVLPRGLHAFDEDYLVLLTEATFAYLMTRVPPATRAHYEAWPTT